MPKDLNTTVLLDFYGSLLTEKQRETLSLYYEGAEYSIEVKCSKEVEGKDFLYLAFSFFNE